MRETSAYLIACLLLLQSSLLKVSGFTIGRREALGMVGSVATVLTNPMASLAAAGPTKEELERIRVGHAQIVDLLNNFEQATTVCRENGGECKRDAEPIRKALGLRSTTDPLFQIEKVFAKVKDMDSMDVDQLEAFFEATEDWNSAMNMSNSMVRALTGRLSFVLT